MADRVLITGARSAAALELARAFDRDGYEVHVADCSPARISRWSRSVAQCHPYPSPVREPAAFRARLIALDEALEPRIIVPTCEEIFHLAVPVLQDTFGERLFAPPAAILRRLHDKGSFASLCAELDLPCPETHAIDSGDALLPFKGTSRDWVFKSRFSRFGEGTLVGPDSASLAAIRPASGQSWIAQRRIAGQEASFYAVARDGKITAFAAYASQWRLGGGASMAFDPVDDALASTALDLASRLAHGLRFTGQFACDMMVDAAGQPWLIECNPRATSGVHLLAHGSGLSRAFLRTDGPPLRGNGSSAHLLPAMLTYGLASAIGSARTGAWCAQLRSGRDVTGIDGDRKPMFGAIVDGVAFTWSGVRRGISATAATTADIEWNGEELA